MFSSPSLPYVLVSWSSGEAESAACFSHVMLLFFFFFAVSGFPVPTNTISNLIAKAKNPRFVVTHSCSSQACSMPLTDLYRVLRDSSRHQPDQREKLRDRLLDVFLRTWDLGFTAFGGPNVHFQIFYRRFVDSSGAKAPWVDEQTVSDSLVPLNTLELQHSEGLPEFTRLSSVFTRTYHF